MNRAEPILVAVCLASWSLALLHLTGVVSLAGNLDLSLYGLYAIAAVAGWLAGNVYIRRRQGMPPSVTRRLLVAYLFGPPSIPFLLRAMAPLSAQTAAPFVPLYAVAVCVVFFFVPVTFGRTAERSGGER